MPYSIVTKDGITLRGIPDDVPPDSPELKARVAAIRAQRAPIPGQEGESARVAAAQANRPGLVDTAIGAGEAALSTLTGATGGTLGMIGGTLKGLAEQILSGKFGTQEAAQLVEQSAAQGAQALTYAPRGQSGQDQAAVVGQAMQGLIPVAAVSPGLTAATAGLKPAAALVRGGAAAVADRVATGLPQRAAQVLRTEGAGMPKAAAVGALPVEQLAQTARKAGEGGLGSTKAAQVLAEQAAPDPAIVKSAERLGVQEYLQPDHVTTSEAYRQVVATIKSNPQSAVALAEREGLARVAERASSLVDEIGGGRDLSALDQNLKANLQTTAEVFDTQAEGLYAKLREGMPARAPTEAPSVLSFIEQRAGDLGGVENLTSMEKMILRKLAPKEVKPDVMAPAEVAPAMETLQQFMRRNKFEREVMPPEVKGRFLGWLRSAGGIDFAQKADITGERGGVRANPAGIFRTGGRATDELAMLAEEQGYLRPGQGADSGAFVDLVQQAIRGDQPLTIYGQMDRAARNSQAQGVADRLSAVEQRLKLAGVDTSPARGNPAVLEAYAAKYEDALMRAAVDDARARGAATDMPQWSEMQQRAVQVAEDIGMAGRTLAEYERDIGPLSPVMRKMVADKLRQGGAEVAPDVPAKPAGVGPTYALLDDVRRDLTAAKYKRQGPFKDADTGLIKALEKRLMEDQRAAVEPYGMLDTFDAARTAVRLRKGIENDLSSLFGRDLDRSMVGGGEVGLPGAVSALAKGDASRLTRLLKAVPEGMRQEVVASGLSTVLRKAATRGELDFTGYAKWYEGLKRNRQAYSAIMSNLPLGAAKQMEALYRVSVGVSESLNRRTKTGALNTIKAEMMEGDGLMERLYSVASRASAGVAAEAITTPLGIPGAGVAAGLTSALSRSKSKPMAAVDSMIASPEFAQLVRSASGGRERVAKVAAVARSPEFLRFMRSLNLRTDLSAREAWILQAMQPQSAGQQQQRDMRAPITDKAPA